MMAATRQRFDTIAVALSGLCFVHCLALPLLVISFPLIAPWAMDDMFFHRSLLLVVIPVSVIALLLGYRAHHSRRTLLLASAGIAILTMVAITGHEGLSPLSERIATTVGGVVLASSHLLNAWLARNQQES
jgi:hypothetical protein